MKPTLRIAEMLLIALGGLVLLIAGTGGIALFKLSNIAVDLDHVVAENAKQLESANTRSESVHIVPWVTRTDWRLAHAAMAKAKHPKKPVEAGAAGGSSGTSFWVPASRAGVAWA
jgi:hypothetical protein